MMTTGSWVLCLLIALSLVAPGSSLFFFLDNNDPKCFLEELPKDTHVVVIYRSLELQPNDKGQADGTQGVYQVNPEAGIRLTVEEAATGHRIVDQKGAHEGRFSFTTTESGDHSICLTSNHTSWFQMVKTKLYLDLVIGANEEKESVGSEAISDLVHKVRELNSKISTIQREQQYQRQREQEFRDLSESVNSRVVYWAILQAIVLGLTCVWQMRHLKNFFVAKKLV